MVLLLSVLLWMGQFYNYPVVPNAPTGVQDPKFPLRVKILGTNWTHGPLGTHGWGRGDLVVPQRQGFDYTYDCSQPFMVTTGDEIYSARWKKQDKQLELLVGKIGSDNKAEKCELNVNLQPFVYERRNGGIVTVPLPQ
ncbi:MAG: hypothetical protein WA663_09600 [Candidatus Acidiferrales bacterium]